MSIIYNKAKCFKCGSVIESKHVHDFVWCQCGAIAVDGGKEYLKRVGNPEDCIELSLTTEDPPFGITMGTMELAVEDSSGESTNTTVDGAKGR